MYENEIWKTLIYNNIKYDMYSISNYGRIKSNKTNTIYKTNIDRNGYRRFTIYLGFKDNKIINKNITIHRAVAETFILNPNKLPVINHKDGIKTNNYAGTLKNNFTDGNLEWCTRNHNVQHAITNNLVNYKNITGCNNINSSLSKQDILFIRANYIANDKIYGCRALAKYFNVSSTVISLIVNYKTYKNI